MSTLIASKLFYTHAFEVILIIGVLFTLIGYLMGRCIWGKAEKQAAQISAHNGDLKDLISHTKQDTATNKSAL